MRILRVERTMLIYYVSINILTFVLMGLDKMRARAHLWRIPERVLLGLTWLGGPLGTVAGMQMFRHKTRKPLFWISAVISIVLHLVVIYFSQNQ